MIFITLIRIMSQFLCCKKLKLFLILIALQCYLYRAMVISLVYILQRSMEECHSRGKEGGKGECLGR